MGACRTRPATGLALVMAGMALAPFVGLGGSVAQDSPSHVSATMRDGRVTLSAQDVALRDVLTEFGRASGIEMRLEPGATADDEATTIAFERMPPEEGLRRLLRTKNFVFVYSGSALAEVRTYTRIAVVREPSAGPTVRSNAPPTEAERREGLRLRAQALGDPDPDERTAGLLELAGGDNEQLALETATRMLEIERVADVLQTALMVLARMDPVPIEPLLAFVNANRVPDASVRIQALELMANRRPVDPRVRQTLAMLASGDRNQDVRDSAQSLLETLTDN